MKVSLIVAVAENRAIGKDNDLIWHLPDDMKFFRDTTAGKPVIMGRRNYDSIPSKYRPLPGRKNIIVTRQKDFKAPGCTVVHSLNAALELEHATEEVFIIGGGQIFDLALRENLVDQMYITEIHHSFEGDVFFPEIDQRKWEKRILGEHPSDEKHAYSFTFTAYTKISKN